MAIYSTNPLAVVSAGIICSGLIGCATMVKGSSQEVAINTNPPGATCLVNQAGVDQAMLDASPAKVEVKRRNQDLLVTCRKDGFKETSITLHPETEPWTVANLGLLSLIVVQKVSGLGALVGFGVDSMTGSWNKYPETVNVTMLASSSEEIK